jgi:LmbE family N-acetylglucosaminyl deacetylase
MAPELTLMAVHAHPDDEAIATGGVLAKAAAEGIRTVVVTCTNGDYGDGPGGVKPGEEGHDPEQVVLTRRAELEEACRRLGVANLELLGYHDSGMAAWTYKEQPGVFARVPVAEAASRLGALFEAYRPDAVVTYEQDAAYDHPDHVQAARITLAAMDLVPVARKLYLTAFNTRRWEQLETLLRERGIELPFPDPTPEWQERLARSQQQITTPGRRPALGRAEAGGGPGARQPDEPVLLHEAAGGPARDRSGRGGVHPPHRPHRGTGARDRPVRRPALRESDNLP